MLFPAELSSITIIIAHRGNGVESSRPVFNPVSSGVALAGFEYDSERQSGLRVEWKLEGDMKI